MVRVVHLFSFLCCVVFVCFLSFRPVSCVANVSGFSILDCPFGFIDVHREVSYFHSQSAKQNVSRNNIYLLSTEMLTSSTYQHHHMMIMIINEVLNRSMTYVMYCGIL